VIITSCEQNPTAPNEPPKPYGYQEDIYWPSLADSPWPMNHHDPQNTGRGTYIGPQEGIINWKFNGLYIEAAPVMASDSILYFTETGAIHSLNINSKLNWTYNTNSQLIMTPLISKDGTVYFASFAQNSFLIALFSDSTEKWKIDFGKFINPFMINMDKEGNIYVVAEKTLFCVSPSNQIIWSIEDIRINEGGNGISFSPDGETLYIPGISVSVLAVDISTHTIKWEFGDKTLSAPPSIDNSGNLYFVPLSNTDIDSLAFLFSINDEGSQNWKYPFIYQPLTGLNLKSPTIDLYGNIYFATDTLYSLKYNGGINWVKPLVGICDCPLVCDLNSNVYVATQSGKEGKIFVYCFDFGGNEKWSIGITEQQVGLSPALTKAGEMLFCAWRGLNLYNIK